MSEVTGYKINTQKPLAFLYTNNENPETDIRKIIPFTTATQRIKCQNKSTLTDKRHVHRKLEVHDERNQ